MKQKYNLQFTSKLIQVEADNRDDAIAKGRAEICGDPIAYLSLIHYSGGD
jgi:hypothetical protein